MSVTKQKLTGKPVSFCSEAIFSSRVILFKKLSATSQRVSMAMSDDNSKPI